MTNSTYPSSPQKPRNRPDVWDVGHASFSGKRRLSTGRLGCRRSDVLRWRCTSQGMCAAKRQVLVQLKARRAVAYLSRDRNHDMLMVTKQAVNQ